MHRRTRAWESRAARLMAAAFALLVLCAAAEAAPSGAPQPPSRWTMDSDADALAEAAKAGDAAAQYALGMKLWLGKGVGKDINAAIVWLSRAASQQYALGDTALGLMYDEGDGVSQDAAKAAFFFTRSAIAGEALAQSRLGLLYMHGRGVALDMVQAARWFRAAANQGLPDAENNLGYLYAQGLGVPKDVGLAISWYQKAAQGGNEAAKENLANMKAEPIAPAAGQAEQKGQQHVLELKDIVAALEAHPLDDNGRAGDYGKPGPVEIKTEPSADKRLEEVRVGFVQAAGPSAIAYRIYGHVEEAMDAYMKFAKLAALNAPALAARPFAVGLMSNNRPFTFHCVQMHDAKAAPDAHQIACAYSEDDAPLVYVGTTAASYKDAEYPPDDVLEARRHACGSCLLARPPRPHHRRRRQARRLISARRAPYRRPRNPCRCGRSRRRAP